MKLMIEPFTDSLGYLREEGATYNPPKEIRDRIAEIQRDLSVAQAIRDESFEEFNHLDLITFLNECNVRFNENTPQVLDSSDDDWKSNIVRPMTRNKVREMAAQTTQAILYPSVRAQNDDNEEDRDASAVMEDLVEFALSQDSYEEKFVDLVYNLLTTPAAILHQDFARVFREIKKIKEDGTYEKETILDELYSGFKLNLVNVDDFFISNPYEPNVQKQPFLVWARAITYEEAFAKYGHLEDFKYVEPGLRFQYFEDKDTFFQKFEDGINTRLVYEAIYYNRPADLEIVMLNGVMIHGDPDRPLQRQDKKYPFTVGGYERFNSRFFFFRPLVWALKGLQDEVDVMHRMVIDGTFLQVMPPITVFGEDVVDASIYKPGTVHPFGEETRVAPFTAGSNLNAGLNLLTKLESEASETSQNQLAGGAPLEGDRTKFEIQQIQQNAMVKLGLFGKRVGFMVSAIGDLTIGSVLQHMPIMEINEVTGEDNAFKFQSVYLPNRDVW